MLAKSYRWFSYKTSLQVLLLLGVLCVGNGNAQEDWMIGPNGLSVSPQEDVLALVLLRKGDHDISRIQLVNVDGSGPLGCVEISGFVDSMPVWSPDGKELAFCLMDFKAKTAKIHVLDVTSLKERKLTTGPGVDLEPRWFFDGSKVGFMRMHGKEKVDLGEEASFFPPGLYIINVDGSGEKRLTDSTSSIYTLSWDWLKEKVYFLITKGNVTEIWKLDISTGKQHILYSIKGKKGKDATPFISCAPDGENLSFLMASLITRSELWLLKVDGSGKRKLPVRCAIPPVWVTKTRLITVDIDGTVWDFDIERKRLKKVAMVKDISMPPRWLDKTSQLLFVRRSRSVWVMDADGSNKRRIYPSVLSKSQVFRDRKTINEDSEAT